MAVEKKGMVMRAAPIYDCYKSIEPKVSPNTKVIYLVHKENCLIQKMAEELSKRDDLIFLCGHYEGVDERIIEEIITDEISIGDYVLTGGELAAMVVIDSISRLIPNVLGKEESYRDESFSDNLLEYPHYRNRPMFKQGKFQKYYYRGIIRKNIK